MKKETKSSAKPSKSLLYKDIRQLIDGARSLTAQTINSTLSMMYWNIGKRINADILQYARAEYGQQIIESLSRRLTVRYGSGWSAKQLRHCVRFADVFPKKKIVYTLCRQLGWSHIRAIIYLDDALKRDFYIELCKVEHWSFRILRERINSMLYERTAISKKPGGTIKHDLALLKNEKKMSPDLAFRDPYFLNFLGLSDTYSENDLENAIAAELQRFIIEFGNDFAFLARQKRITIDNKDYYIDLLFFHRRLKRLVAIDLKIGEFDAAYKGQMELYLNYLQKHEQMDGENGPIGLILCTGKNTEHIELMQLEKSNIRVAEYFTVLPSKAKLKAGLHKAIEIAQMRLAAKEDIL